MNLKQLVRLMLLRKSRLVLRCQSAAKEKRTTHSSNARAVGARLPAHVAGPTHRQRDRLLAFSASVAGHVHLEYVAIGIGQWQYVVDDGMAGHSQCQHRAGVGSGVVRVGTAAVANPHATAADAAPGATRCAVGGGPAPFVAGLATGHHRPGAVAGAHAGLPALCAAGAARPLHRV